MGHLLRFAEPIEAGHERVMQRSRYIELLDPLIEAQAPLGQGLGQLLNEQGHAVGALHDGVDQLRRRWLP